MKILETFECLFTEISDSNPFDTFSLLILKPGVAWFTSEDLGLKIAPALNRDAGFHEAAIRVYDSNTAKSLVGQLFDTH